MKQNRTPGHGLVSEGAAHVIDERGQAIRIKWNTVSGNGRGLCSCGALSDFLTSAHQRKAWHRQHKAEVSA